MARYLTGLAPRTLRVTRLALRVFEWLPFPWRFSRMSIEARTAYLAKLEDASFFLYRDLLLFAKTLAMMGYARDARVRDAVGYEIRCALGQGSAPPEVLGLGDLEPQGSGEECDVAIVGSGAGGAAAAAVLAEAGLDVLVLEAGPYLDHSSYPSDPLEALPRLYRDGGLTVAEGRPSIPVPVGRAVGGTTVINSGTCFRTPEHVLQEWRRLEGIGWATDLDDEFSDAERTLDVITPPIERIGRNGQLCMEGAQALGASGGTISRNAGHCVQCSSCPVGCRIDAKRAMHVSYLPRAVAAGARIRAGVEVERVLIESGRVVGLDCRARNPAGSNGAAPRRWRVRTETVVVAGGSVGTPELLLRSGARHPKLGHNLHIHPAAWIGARYEEEVRGWEGIMQSYYVDQWQRQGVLLEATFTPLSFGAQWLPGVGREHQRRILDFNHLGSIGVHLSDRSEGRVGLHRDGSLRMTYHLLPDEVNVLQFGIARAAEIHFAAGATEVYPQVGPVSVIPRGRLAEFEALRLRPHDMRLEAFHPMGTARMGANEDIAVTDTTGAVRGVEGLYVADAALLPTSIGVNPMLTIIAVARRVARGIADRGASTRQASGDLPGAIPAVPR